MSAYQIVWFKHGLNYPWQCCFRTFPSRRYSRPSDWLQQAEDMMVGRAKEDALHRKNDQQARQLIWC
jgi:hypothetical protein